MRNIIQKFNSSQFLIYRNLKFKIIQGFQGAPFIFKAIQGFRVAQSSLTNLYVQKLFIFYRKLMNFFQ